jgi:hypothetical protein
MEAPGALSVMSVLDEQVGTDESRDAQLGLFKPMRDQ